MFRVEHEIITHPMARIPKPSAPKKSSFSVRTFTLTEDVEETLRQLSSDATDFLGRTVSESAVIRALVRQIAQQSPPASSVLFLEIEKELQAGTMWGKKK